MKELHILSLGAGVQSTALALMSEHGEIQKFDCAIFADTAAEPSSVYTHLDWLESKLSYPAHRVMHKQGLIQGLKDGMAKHRFANVPFFTTSKDNELGGMTRRQCTREFKIEPITQKTRRLLGVGKGKRVKDAHVFSYHGISLDEIQRMTESRDKWMTIKYPLIEKRMTRHDCLLWLQRNGYPEPPKSACTFCPYHTNAMWRDMKLNDPESFKQAVEVDEMVRRDGAGTKNGSTETVYVHRSLKPLKDVDFSNDTDRGQLSFLDECDGMCGV